MRRTPPALALALIATLAFTGSGAAHALGHPNHASVTDKSGDAPAKADLLSGRYHIDKKVARFTAHVKQLSDTTFLAFEIWPLTDAWDRLAVFKEHGKVVGRNYFVDNSLEDSNQPVPHLKPCKNLKIRWNTKADTVRVTWPQSCRQASTKGTLPFEFHVFSRIGGVSGSPGDSLPARTLDF